MVNQLSEYKMPGKFYITVFTIDHNIDFIVKFPDWDPSEENQMQKLSALPFSRRFLFRELSAEFPRPHLWYANQDVVNALRLFLDAKTDLAGSLSYRTFDRYDLVDLTRQALSKLANQVYLDAVTAYPRKDAKSLDLHNNKVYPTYRGYGYTSCFGQ